MSTRLELRGSEEEELDEESTHFRRARVVRRRRRSRRPGRSLHSAMATATHHLRAPLASALANLEILEDATLGQLSEEQQLHLRFAREGLNELERTVGDLLALARLQEGPVPLQCRAVDVALLVGEVRRRMEPRARQSGIGLTVVGCDTVVEAVTDAKYLDYLLTELVENAIRYCGEQGTVTLCVEPTSRLGIRIEVRDDGPGIPDGDVERIFEPFYQRPAHTSHQARGTGLGLAIVKRLAELLQARIDLRNPPAGGSIFTVELPIRFDPRR